MKYGKHEKIPPAAPGKRKLTLFICLVLLLAAGVSATLAYFSQASAPVINTFQAGTPGVKVDETFSGDTKTKITVSNTGDYPVYVRVRLVTYFEDEQGNVLAKDSPILNFSEGDNWVELGEYYYYNAPLTAGSTTENLLESSITMTEGQVIEVLADTVQATPEQAVTETWGVASSAFVGK